MFICPFCQKEFSGSDEMSKHYLFCWKETHPNKPIPKEAPHSEDIETREISPDIELFFSTFKKGVSYDRSQSQNSPYYNRYS